MKLAVSTILFNYYIENKQLYQKINELLDCCVKQNLSDNEIRQKLKALTRFDIVIDDIIDFHLYGKNIYNDKKNKNTN